MYNTLNNLHHLLVELVLIHRRDFVTKQRISPGVVALIRDFLKVWVISDTSFDGLLTIRQRRDVRDIYYGYSSLVGSISRKDRA
jgi:hypothetical protein